MQTPHIELALRDQTPRFAHIQGRGGPRCGHVKPDYCWASVGWNPSVCRRGFAINGSGWGWEYATVQNIFTVWGKLLKHELIAQSYNNCTVIKT